jgi:hypothetical protein
MSRQSLAQVLDVLGQLGFGGALGHRAHDEAAGFFAGHQPTEFFAQRFAIGLPLDALRDADVFVLRQVDQHAPGDRHLRGQARALAAHRILDHLHEDALTLEQQALDRSHRLVAEAWFADVGHMQERGTAQADVDERRLHARQDAHDASDVDVADEAATGAAFDMQFLHDALVRDGDARFLRRKVDQDLFGHGGAIWRMGVEMRFRGLLHSTPSRPFPGFLKPLAWSLPSCSPRRFAGDVAHGSGLRCRRGVCRAAALQPARAQQRLRQSPGCSPAPSARRMPPAASSTWSATSCRTTARSAAT